jgi:3-oxoacyl-[acyl-carrier protein] reductase
MLSSESVSGLSIQLIDKDEYNKEVAEKMSRVTVITGGTSGIGRGIVEKILANSEQDDLIFATYAHNAYKANDFWDSLKPEDQEKLIIMKADMSSYDDMMNFVKEVKEKAGHVDWLISNAGISTYDKFQDYTFEEWNNIVNTNLSIPVFMIKEFMPVMTEGGRVLFMGSYAGQQAYSSSLVYGVTKAAIHFLTKSLVKEFEPKGITVNAIAPGFIQTPWHENRTPESYERINRKIALHRFGEIKDVADMAYSILTYCLFRPSKFQEHIVLFSIIIYLLCQNKCFVIFYKFEQTCSNVQFIPSPIKVREFLLRLLKCTKKIRECKKNSRQFLKKLLHFICREFKRIFAIHFRHLV